MRNKKSNRTKKALAILLVFCFVLSLSAALASASDNVISGQSEAAYKAGFDKGYQDGKVQGKIECKQYGTTSTLSKIPSPYNDHNWSKDYRESYNNGYAKGYFDGYHRSRYGCLK